MIKKAKEFNGRIAWRSFAFFRFFLQGYPVSHTVETKTPYPFVPPCMLNPLDINRCERMYSTMDGIA